jgi:hypothetical protein
MSKLNATYTRPSVVKVSNLPPVLVKVRSRVTFTHVFIGSATGRRYSCPPLGEILVRQEDLQQALSIVTNGGGCCGSFVEGGFHYYEEA